MVYRKLSRVTTHGYLNRIPGFLEEFPELKGLDKEELGRRFDNLNIEYYQEDVTKVNLLIRFTLPIAVILLLSMYLFMPVYFIITGKWGYSLGNNNKIINWFKALKLQ